MKIKPPNIGAFVRIRGTPETLAAEVAGRVGQVLNKEGRPLAQEFMAFGNTAAEDYVYQVFFEEQNERYWFAPYMLEVVNSARPANMDAAVGGVEQRGEGHLREPAAATGFVGALSRLKRLFKRKTGGVADNELPTTASIKS